MDPIAIVSIVLGGLICFFGYTMIHSAIRAWGFFIGGVFFVVLAVGLFKMPGGINSLTPQMGIVFAVGGVVGALIAGPLSAVIVFLSGMALGFFLGNYAFPLITRGQEITLLTVGLALATGILSVAFQEVVLIVTTAFVGAVMVVYGAFLVASIEALPAVIVFFLLGFFGAAAQYKSAHPESSLLRF
jgi:hypothetical protein